MSFLRPVSGTLHYLHGNFSFNVLPWIINTDLHRIPTPGFYQTAEAYHRIYFDGGFRAKPK